MKRPTHSGSRAAGLRFGIFSLTLALSTAYAAKPGTANGFDLDIQQFRTTTKVELSSRKGADIRIDLSVRNRSDLDGTAVATLVGRSIPGNSPLIARQFDVYDPPGGGATAFSYTIDAADIDMGPSFGAIRWTVSIADVDRDVDTATDITVVRP